MIALLFTATALLFASLSVYFLWRWLLYRRLQSLVCMVLPVGWVLALARELRWLPRPFTTPLLALGFVVGLVCVLLVLHAEMQQRKPFR